jgi:hypothetical protein
MAIQTRYVGDAFGINNVDQSTTTGNVIIATGLTKNPIALKVLLGNTQTFITGEMATGGAVETILRQIAIDSTVVMYQVDTSTPQMDILVEASGAGTQSGGVTTNASVATAIQTRLQNLGANIGIASNIWAGGGLTVTSANGFKLF